MIFTIFNSGMTDGSMQYIIFTALPTQYLMPNSKEITLKRLYWQETPMAILLFGAMMTQTHLGRT